MCALTASLDNRPIGPGVSSPIVTSVCLGRECWGESGPETIAACSWQSTPPLPGGSGPRFPRVRHRVAVLPRMAVRRGGGRLRLRSRRRRGGHQSPARRRHPRPAQRRGRTGEHHRRAHALLARRQASQPRRQLGPSSAQPSGARRPGICSTPERSASFRGGAWSGFGSGPAPPNRGQHVVGFTG
jgi:hypothetical protein